MTLQLPQAPEPPGMRLPQPRAQLADIPAERISTAALALMRVSLVRLDRGVLFASPAASHLDRLDVVAV